MNILIALTALLAMVQDKEDPRFKYWSSCKPGSWVKTKMVIDQGGMKGEMEQTQKLLDVADDKLTIEISGSMKMSGKDVPIPPENRKSGPRIRRASSRSTRRGMRKSRSPERC